MCAKAEPTVMCKRGVTQSVFVVDKEPRMVFKLAPTTYHGLISHLDFAVNIIY